MAKGLNRVMLIGNLGKDPELRYTQSNQPVLSLRLATNENFKNRDGEWQERTEWHSITVWGDRAKGLERIVSKGTQLYVEGRLQTRQWKDKQGQDRYTTEVVARDVILLGRKGGGDGPPPYTDSDGPSGYDNGGFNDGPQERGGPDDFSDDDIPF